MTISRRHFVRGAAAATAALLLERWLDAQALGPVPGGRLVRTMPLGRFDGRPTPPLHVLLGSGLDARQFTDLSALDDASLVTPASRFYVRTAHMSDLPPADGWRIAVGGEGVREFTLDRASLEKASRDVGIRLMECAGNADPANFGLLSAAAWSGVPLGAVLDRLPSGTRTARIRVTGLDDERRPSVTSNPGASWVFTRDELESRGAFLATAMNGSALTADHGSPVRLLVPNYYGCSCIKWVSRIDLVPDDAPATTQMMEFSARTHQAGIPALARDYVPPAIELAATPVRVEQWISMRDGQERVGYRVVGVRWGGTSTQPPLTIRFRSSDRFQRVSNVPLSDNPATWSLWSHEWTPATPGRYQIALGVADRSVPARRLDLFYYTREVEIDRV